MANNPILKVVHDTAKGLYKAGAMNAATMREFDALCLPPIKLSFSPDDVEGKIKECLPDS